LATQSPLRLDPLDEVNEKYHQAVSTQCCFNGELNEDTKMKFTYSAMHGVGYQFVQRLFSQFGIPEVIPVKEQVTPDPDFPTVKFPNPEEGKSALVWCKDMLMDVYACVVHACIYFVLGTLDKLYLDGGLKDYRFLKNSLYIPLAMVCVDFIN
jgi:hypothetical protein